MDFHDCSTSMLVDNYHILLEPQLRYLNRYHPQNSNSTMEFDKTYV